MGQVAVFERSVTTPRHGSGHGPKVAALARRGTIISYLHLVTGEKVLTEESQKDEVHAAKFRNTK